jgi:hypothetical protein
MTIDYKTDAAENAENAKPGILLRVLRAPRLDEIR